MTPDTEGSVPRITGEAIDRLVRRIVEHIHPLRILLFGSATRGELAVGSDIDLLVVMPDGTHRRRTAQRLYRRMRGIGIPFDIVVATPRDLDRHKDNIGLIYRSILLEGREVYQPDDVAPGSPEDWLRYARSDLAIARAYSLHGALVEALCFHAQQAAKKR